MSPLGDFPCSSFLNDDFASYFTPLAALAILCCHILGMSRLTSDVELTYDIACDSKSSIPDRVG